MPETKHQTGEEYGRRPCVTFALFAYNQEQYVREAIEGAFAQTYEPLNIILSDDCSSDRTFEIMQEMAENYSGPHSVSIKKHEKNLGVIDHALAVADLAETDLLIVAAGDDISYPNRTEVVVQRWLGTRATALYSGCDECADNGEVIRRNCMAPPLAGIDALFAGCSAARRFDGRLRSIPGYSAAYETEVLKQIPRGAHGANNEDVLFSYILNLRGNLIEEITDPLVCRRLSASSISARNEFDSVEKIKANEFIIQRYASSTLKFLDFFFGLEHLFNKADYSKVKSRLERSVRYNQIISAFWSARADQRVVLATGCRTKDELKFVLPRLFGMRVFCALKLFFRSGKVS